jgi:hypothetical protein
MALFEKVQRLSSEFHEELIQFYREQGPFPIEVRNLLAKQIEATLWYVSFNTTNRKYYVYSLVVW